MTKRVTSSKLCRKFSASTPSAGVLLFGPAPVIAGEDPAEYNELLIHVSTAVKAADIIDDAFVRDITDHLWETRRLRRLRADLMNGLVIQALSKELDIILGAGAEDAAELLRNWKARNPRAIERVNQLVPAATLNAIVARTLSQHLHAFEPVDRLIASAANLRNAALREMDRHQAALAERLRRTVDRIERQTIEGRRIEEDPAGEGRVVEDDRVGEQRAIGDARAGEQRSVEGDQ